MVIILKMVFAEIVIFGDVILAQMIGSVCNVVLGNTSQMIETNAFLCLVLYIQLFSMRINSINVHQDAWNVKLIILVFLVFLPIVCWMDSALNVVIVIVWNVQNLFGQMKMSVYNVRMAMVSLH